MAYKFKIDDIVEIVADTGIKTGESHEFKLGRKGKVTYVDTLAEDHPYRVLFRNEDLGYFNVKELKLIKRKGD
jgi:hypothetical protein